MATGGGGTVQYQRPDAMRLFADLLPQAAPTAPAQGRRPDAMRLFADLVPQQPSTAAMAGRGAAMGAGLMGRMLMPSMGVGQALGAPAAAPSPPQSRSDLLKPGAGDVFAHGLLNTATFGLADRATSYIDSGISHLIPSFISERVVSPAESYAQIKRTYAKGADEHPIASLAGMGAGALAPSGAAVNLLKAAAAKGAPWAIKALRTLAPEAPTALGNVARAAVAGGAGGAAGEFIESGELTANTAVAGATGAVLGPIGAKLVGMGVTAGGKAANWLLSTMAAGEVNAAMTLLAKKLNVKPAQLQADVDALRLKTGRPATMAEVLSNHDANVVRDLANMNPNLAAGLQKSTARLEAELPTVLADRMAREGWQITPRPPGASGPPDNLNHVEGFDRPDVQDYASQDTARRLITDDSMVPLAGKTVTFDDPAVFTDPDIQAAIGALPSADRAKLRDAVAAATDNGTGVDLPLVEVVEPLRRALNHAADAPSNMAGKFKNLAEEVEGVAGAAHPEYAAIIKRYHKYSDQIRGFNYGKSGKTFGDLGSNINANDSGWFQRSVMSPEGRMGFASGVTARNVKQAGASEAGARGTASSLAEAGSDSALNAAALGPVKAARITASSTATRDALASQSAATPPLVRSTDAPGAQDAATALLEGSTGMHGRATVHAVKAVSKIFGSGKMSPSVEARVLEFLTDPDPTRQAAALAILKRVGASAQDLLRIQTVVSGMIGASVGPMAATPPLHRTAQ